ARCRRFFGRSDDSDARGHQFWCDRVACIGTDEDAHVVFPSLEVEVLRLVVRTTGIETHGSRIARSANRPNGLVRYWNRVRSGVVTNSSAGMPACNWICG